MVCPLCQVVIRQVSSATPELAMSQHLLWIHSADRSMIEAALKQLRDARTTAEQQFEKEALDK